MAKANKQGINANEIFRKTMPFVWAKLLLGIATVVVSAIVLAIFIGIASLFSKDGVNGGVLFVLIIIWLGITGIIRFILNHWLGYLIKAGHIAVITEAVTTGKVPDNLVTFGKEAVKERFATSNIYFLLDKLVSAAVKQIQRVVGKVTGAVSKLPIPGMGTVTGLAQFFVSISLGYIDECCLGYTFYKKKQKAFKSAADGVVIYSQNIKTLLGSAAKTMTLVVLGLVGITLVLFLIIGAVFRLTPLSNSPNSGLIGFIAFLIAVLLAVAIKYAFMDSIILIRTMVTYMEFAPNTELKVDLYTNLCKVSGKFRELFNKGQEEDGKPQIKDAPADNSITGLINKGREKLSAAVDSGAGGETESGGGDTVFCSECGKKNTKGDKFCSSCGEPLKKK